MGWTTFTSFTSTNIASARYNSDEQLLEVSFVSGTTYHYYDVPQHVADGFEGAGSKGEYFARHIKGHFRYSRL